MMVKVGADVDRMVKESDQYIELMTEQVEGVSINTLIRWINILSTLENELKWTSQGRILFEVAIAKLMNPIYDSSLEGLVERIEQLEKGAPMMMSTPQVTQNRPPVTTTKKVEKTEVKQAPVKETVQEKVVEQAPPVQRFPKGDVGDAELNQIRAAWDQILSSIKDKNIRVHAFLMEGDPKIIKNNELLVGFDDVFGFHLDMLSRPENKQLVEQVISSFVQKDMIVKCVFNSSISIDETAVEEEPTDELEALKSFVGDAGDKMEIIE
jgi:DNA polymerase-3 subunit gamma/tau